jgi:hypothetical protein
MFWLASLKFLVDSLHENESTGDAHKRERVGKCMKVVGDGCSDPLNPSVVRSSSLHYVDASVRVVSEIHESTNNPERDLARAHGRPTTTTEGDLPRRVRDAVRERHGVRRTGNDAALPNGLVVVGHV